MHMPDLQKKADESSLPLAVALPSCFGPSDGPHMEDAGLHTTVYYRVGAACHTLWLDIMTLPPSFQVTLSTSLILARAQFA